MLSLVSLKKLPDYAAFDKNVDRKSPTFIAPQSHPVTEARKPLLFIDLCWCREGESNPQGTKYRRILSPLRLPVPPSRLGPCHYINCGPAAGGMGCVDTKLRVRRCLRLLLDRQAVLEVQPLRAVIVGVGCDLINKDHGARVHDDEASPLAQIVALALIVAEGVGEGMSLPVVA